nr:putative reverse transcriptase domain-containing protein [Tanacetum cinerariifolium]
MQETTEKISQIKDWLKAARDLQKSYADKRMKPLEFSVGDHVLLKVSPWKGVVHFGKKGKLAQETDGETATMFPKEARLRNLYSTPLYVDVIKRPIKKGHDYVEVILYQQTCKGSFQVVVH